MSGQTIDDENSIQHISEQLKSANLPAECVIMEITEQAAVRNLVRASELMRRLRALGCRFALDDFGTGANSLAYLKSLQVSRLKIDGGFVQDILTNKNSEATVRAIVELAKGMAIDTVAEFVENKAIAEKVRGFGVDYAQGYAFGRPEPLDEVLRELADDESLRLHKLFLEI
jgi:EAL domain-containing protein (putative c-di-GMP-specific phosphodiesterase class I)